MIWRRHVDQLVDSDTGKPPDLNSTPDVVPEIPLPDPIVPALPSAHAKLEQAVPSQTPTPVEPPTQPSPTVVERRYQSQTPGKSQSETVSNIEPNLKHTYIMF